MVVHALRWLVNRLGVSVSLILPVPTVASSLNLVGTPSTITVEGALQSAQMVTMETTQHLSAAPVSCS